MGGFCRIEEAGPKSEIAANTGLSSQHPRAENRRPGPSWRRERNWDPTFSKYVCVVRRGTTQTDPALATSTPTILFSDYHESGRTAAAPGYRYPIRTSIDYGDT